MKFLDVFSGIGGFALGLTRAGMEPVAFCEIEPYCQKVLNKHWPHLPVHPDIRELDATEYRGTVGLVCGGYPCQPYSKAGRRAGTRDDRDLWPEMYRIIRECCPRWVVAENVIDHATLGLDEVLSDLENEGYTCWPFIIPACALNAPHRRDRIWIVAHCSSKRVQGLWPSRKQEPNTHGQAPLPVWEGEGSWETQWQVEPRVDRVVDGVSKRVDRVKSLGNSVVPQIPELLGRMILQYEAAQT